jgi:hypothetical protein
MCEGGKGQPGKPLYVLTAIVTLAPHELLGFQISWNWPRKSQGDLSKFSLCIFFLNSEFENWERLNIIVPWPIWH